MPELRARTIPAEGRAAVFDPANPDAFIAKAGRYLVEVKGDTAVVLTQGGNPVTVYPGWIVIIREDGNRVFNSPEQAEILPA